MSDLEIITTSDGSHTVRNKKLNETYHSIHGAVQESVHVFIKNGLEYFFENHPAKIISVVEVGFGTGLNALLTWQYATSHNLEVRYTTLEPFPLPEDIWSKLNYGGQRQGQDYFRLLHETAWDHETSLSPEFTILKLKNSLQQVVWRDEHDVIFFDAFAPSVQPGLWTIESLRKTIMSLRTGGVFVTYSARGQLKRDLKTLGLKVETLPGPPGKNEMVRAVRTR